MATNLPSAKFENCFGTARSTTRVNAIAKDHRQYIADYDSVAEYIWNDVQNNETEIFSWLTESGAKLYNSLDSAEKATVSDLLYDFLFENFNKPL